MSRKPLSTPGPAAMEILTDEQVKRLLNDATDAAKSARSAYHLAVNRRSDAIAELVKRGYVMSLTF